MNEKKFYLSHVGQDFKFVVVFLDPKSALHEWHFVKHSYGNIIDSKLFENRIFIENIVDDNK